jgi:dTDP-4-amino-4,6-dideoxygalactose transaminase
MSSKLAIFGGDKAITKDPGDMFVWPIITKEDEEAVLKVLYARSMSGTDITTEFEKKFAEWQGTKYALGFCNGTMSVLSAMYASGLGCGDEIICPSLTYWASVLPAYSLGATPVFADIEPDSMCIDPKDIERCISDKTKAVMVVHYLGHPADMDNIMRIANKHNLIVIEDVSHAQGGLYKGKKLGRFGHVAAMSIMSGKSFATGEAGMLVTDDKLIYEKALASAHYERFDDRVTTPEINRYKGLPLLGMKGRVNQFASAIGLVQLKYYDGRTAEIRKAMNYFWDLLEGVPGLIAHRVNEKDGSTMAGWYAARGLYDPDSLEGLPIARFCEAVRAEGVGDCGPGCNRPLHKHGLFCDADIYNQGRPTRIANASRDVRELDYRLPRSEAANGHMYSIPWFKHYRPEIIEEYAKAFKKVAANYKDLLEPGVKYESEGQWYFYKDPEVQKK